MTWLEKHYGHHKRMLSVDHALYHWRALFQEVLIFGNSTSGKVVLLDGIVQLTERSSHI
ncbi:hypothetical protein [Microvirga makkahensis]|uniref:PABS domain-containing protein n=1 Tax=Microvirga makkahensis TaxID=1128670 RepID=A0A7X3SMH0_9HYPH|nr:hypothetical protein [Microvirga makkahensis]